MRSYGLNRSLQKDRFLSSPKLATLPARKSNTEETYGIGNANVLRQLDSSENLRKDFVNYEKLKRSPRNSIEPNNMLQLIQGVEFRSMERNTN